MFFKIKIVFSAFIAFLTISSVFSADDSSSRWKLQDDGSIVWNDFSNGMVPHKDHIEASGEQVSTVLRYGVDEKGAFELEFDTSGRTGETKQQALFWDAEPKTVLAMADLSAVVQACWSEPNSISLGNVSASEAVKTRIVVWSAAFPGAAVLSVQPNVPWLKAGPLSEATSDNGTVRPIGLFELEWDEQTLVLPVHGYLAGDVEILPPSIVFGNVATEKVVRTCRLSFVKGDIDVSGISCITGHSAINVNLSPVQGENGMFELTAVWDPSVESSGGLAEGVIEGRDASQRPIFKIPYTVYTVAQ